MRKFLFALTLLPFLSLPALTQDQDAIFKDYNDMRGVLDRLMMSREIADVMRAFGGADEMTVEELTSLENRVRSIYPYDFRHVDVLISRDMGNGWGRELYVYWAGTSYIFATVIFHQRDSELVSINFKFNSDINALIGSF